MRIVPPAFFDHRGDRLKQFKLSKHPESEEHRLYLRADEAVASQVELVMVRHGIQRLDASQTPLWTHRYRLTSAPSTAARECLELLETVVTIPPPQGVDIALTLDYYKDPDSHEDPMQWANTDAGELVTRAKYQRLATAQVRLVAALADVVRRHPAVSATDAVITVPGHDVRRESFGEQLAQGVARALGKPLHYTTTHRLVRPEAKALGEEDDLANEFIVPEFVAGRPVLLIDDVYMSGRTSSAVAAAARRAGAVGVFVLTGARTLKAGKR